MVAGAQARGLNAHVADAASLPYEGEFDAVFSNAVLHWVTRRISSAKVKTAPGFTAADLHAGVTALWVVNCMDSSGCRVP
jgi:hypothetical protein